MRYLVGLQPPVELPVLRVEERDLAQAEAEAELLRALHGRAVVQAGGLVRRVLGLQPATRAPLFSQYSRRSPTDRLTACLLCQ